MNWQKERFSKKQLTSKSFDNDNKLTLKSFFAFCSIFVFFFYKDMLRKDGNDFYTDTVSGFQNTPALHERAKTYSALSFARMNFFNMANLVLLSRKAFVMCYCFRAPIRTFFFDACQICQIVRPALVFGPPNRKKPYNKPLISLDFFGPYCTLRILVFFHRFRWK